MIFSLKPFFVFFSFPFPLFIYFLGHGLVKLLLAFGGSDAFYLQWITLGDLRKSCIL